MHIKARCIADTYSQPYVKYLDITLRSLRDRPHIDDATVYVKARLAIAELMNTVEKFIANGFRWSGYYA